MNTSDLQRRPMSADSTSTAISTVAVTGATGLIGSRLSAALREQGRTVRRLVRDRSSTHQGDVPWDPSRGKIDSAGLEGVDAVVHLAGENITGRWTEAKKKRIRESRVHGTRFLSKSLATLESPPAVLACASAIGFYGDRGDELMRDDSVVGSGFLPEVCQQWEEAAQAARECGIRVVHMRIGVVLSEKGGALKEMLTPFKLGAGGKIGSGRQYMSWIAIDDVVGAVGHVLDHDQLSGPVNVVAPQPVTNAEFTKTLGKVLRRPTIFPLPGFAARLLFGEMAEELLLASTRVAPAKLDDTGYRFAYPELETALRHILGR